MNDTVAFKTIAKPTGKRGGVLGGGGLGRGWGKEVGGYTSGKVNCQLSVYTKQLPAQIRIALSSQAFDSALTP